MLSRLDYLCTDAALLGAGEYADSILEAESTGVRNVVHHHHDHYNWGGWGYYPRPVYAYSGGSCSQKRDHAWIAIPAAMVALATMYFIGQNHAEWSQAKEGIAKLQQKNIEVRQELAHAHPALKRSMQNVFNKQMAIFEHARSEAATGLVLKGILVTSMVATGAGALATGSYIAASLTPLLAYGGVSSVLTAGAMLYRAGFSSMVHTMQQDARELQIAVRQAKAVIKEIS